MHTAVVILGGNTGEVKTTFTHCAQKLQEAGYIIHQASAIYSSRAWGYESEHVFFNQVLVLKTNQNPQQVLHDLLATEILLGRTRHASPDYQDRGIDLDLLFYDDLVLQEPHLEIPHPRLHLRNFCLVPLQEVMPGFVHPVLHKTITELVNTSNDPSEITLV